MVKIQGKRKKKRLEMVESRNIFQGLFLSFCPCIMFETLDPQ